MTMAMAMREPRKIVGRRIIRRAGESDADYLAAAERHLQTLRFGRANLLRVAMSRLIDSIGLDGDINLLVLSDIARGLVSVLGEFQYGTAAAIAGLKHEIIEAEADSQLTLADVFETESSEKLRSLRALAQLGQQTDELAWEFPDARPEIVRRPGHQAGGWVVWGTRVLAEIVELEIAAGQTEDQILEAYPSLPRGVVDAVRRWRVNVDLIIACDDTVVDILDFSLVDLSQSNPPAVVYYARDHLGEHGDWIVSTDDVDAVPRDRLGAELNSLAARWKVKQAIADEDIGWSEWQRRLDPSLAQGNEAPSIDC